MCVFTVFSFFVLWTKLLRVGGLVSAPDVGIANASTLFLDPYSADWSFYDKHQTPSPVTWQGIGIQHHVCMCNQFMAPMYHSFSVDTLTDQTHKISGPKSHRILNFIWKHITFGGPQNGTCLMSAFWHLKF
jgi:hypothetical protein